MQTSTATLASAIRDPERSTRQHSPEVLATVFAKRGKDEWERDLRSADIGCVAVTTTTIEKAYWSDDFGKPSGYVVDVEHPVLAEHLRMDSLVWFSRSATQANPGVLAGAHTNAVLAELGHSCAEVADFRARSIVG